MGIRPSLCGDGISSGDGWTGSKTGGAGGFSTVAIVGDERGGLSGGRVSGFRRVGLSPRGGAIYAVVGPGCVRFIQASTAEFCGRARLRGACGDICAALTSAGAQIGSAAWCGRLADDQGCLRVNSSSGVSLRRQFSARLVTKSRYVTHTQEKKREFTEPSRARRRRGATSLEATTTPPPRGRLRRRDLRPHTPTRAPLSVRRPLRGRWQTPGHGRHWQPVLASSTNQ